MEVAEPYCKSIAGAGMSKLKWNLALMIAVGCAGCQTANDGHSFGSHSGSSKEDLNFETSEDPPVQAKTHFAAAQLAETQGDYNTAIQQYWEAVKLQPNYKEALYRLGISYCHLEHYVDAIDAWKQYVKATSGDATGYSNLGFCNELAGHLAEAEEAYLAGIEKDPKNNPCRVNYGLMLARENRVAEAVLQLQAVLSAAEVHYNLGSVFEQQGKKAQARSEYRKALIESPEFTDAELRLSLLK
jgi:tetratricopeptide (TPR) repeat protein